MNEDRAREKKCPILMMSSSIYAGTHCITIDCMMWRTIPEPEPEKMAREAQIPLRSATKFGYCGLAGKPANYYD